MAQQSHDIKKREDQGTLIHIFLLLCTSLVIAFFLWAYYGQLDIVATAEGEIIPSTKVKSVQHLEGGIVHEILTNEGDRVVKGEPLITLEPLPSGTDVAEIKIRLTRLLFELARLNAESARKVQLILPRSLAKAQPETAKRTIQLFDSRLKRIQNEVTAQEQRIEEQKNAFEEIEVRILNNRKRLKLLERSLKGGL